MMLLWNLVSQLVLVLPALESLRPEPLHCRNIPRDSGFPSIDAWNGLNASIGGTLATVVPSGQYCKDRGGCTHSEWTSAAFRAGIPGAMDQMNWEQDYESVPPQICFPTMSETCTQGKVPLYAVLAKNAAHVQAGVSFARTYKIRLAIKASGHDYLGRSTAPKSLLISTHGLQDITFHDEYNDQGSAVTVGSGVPLGTLYRAAKTKGKILVGGTAATVVAAGGYVQGAGHSALSPLLGLAADNVLGFDVVTGEGELVTVNKDQHEDLFWALRGGGAGSWGVVVSATFKTFPTFNATSSVIQIATKDVEVFGKLIATHAKHVSDLDVLRAGQYYFASRNASAELEFSLIIATLFPGASIEVSEVAMRPFLHDVEVTLGDHNHTLLYAYSQVDVNDQLAAADTAVAESLFLGSRLVPESIYRDSPDAIGTMYEKLFAAGTQLIIGHLVAGGQVAENAHIDSAVHPQWRTAKTHLVVVNSIADPLSPAHVSSAKQAFQKVQLPIMEEVLGRDAASYSNEADSTEPRFQTAFYGPNYAKLSKIKSKYDPDDLFIVAGGVGSERWDAGGFCRVP